MYLRRLRTLMDLYLATDFIDELAMGYLDAGFGSVGHSLAHPSSIVIDSIGSCDSIDLRRLN